MPLKRPLVVWLSTLMRVNSEELIQIVVVSRYYAVVDDALTKGIG